MRRLTMYILQGDEPVPCEDTVVWGRWFENVENRRIACDELPGDVTVSTVFLGIDHRLLEGRPILFETLVFGGNYDQSMRRYETAAAARAGHQAIVAELRAAGAVERN